MSNFSSSPAISTPKASQEPPHIQRAHEMAQLIFTEHPPREQNEMVEAIIYRTLDRRRMETENLIERKDSMQKELDLLLELTLKMPQPQQ